MLLLCCPVRRGIAKYTPSGVVVERTVRIGEPDMHWAPTTRYYNYQSQLRAPGMGVERMSGEGRRKHSSLFVRTDPSSHSSIV